jgi:hypothetical protein
VDFLQGERARFLQAQGFLFQVFFFGQEAVDDVGLVGGGGGLVVFVCEMKSESRMRSGVFEEAGGCCFFSSFFILRFPFFSLHAAPRPPLAAITGTLTGS